MNRKVVLLIPQGVLLLLLAFTSGAQTPLTDISFWEPYAVDFKFVKAAADTGVITDEIAKYLLDEKVSNDLKAAIINALSFDFEEKHNATVYLQRLKPKYHFAESGYLPLDTLNAQELLCYGYLTVMDNYFEFQEAIPILELAIEKEPLDCSINLVLAILKAQQGYMKSSCEAAHQLSLFENSFDYFSSPILKEAYREITKYQKELEKKCESR